MTEHIKSYIYIYMERAEHTVVFYFNTKAAFGAYFDPLLPHVIYLFMYYLNVGN